MSTQPDGPTAGAPAEREALLATWHLLLQLSTRVVREFDRRFELEHRTSAREFDVLINLDNAPGDGLRMTDLADGAMLSSGGLTRLVGRLEERGLVRRSPDAADARAIRVRLTDAGRERMRQMRSTHDDIVIAVLAAHVDVAELAEVLARALGGPGSAGRG